MSTDELVFYSDEVKILADEMDIHKKIKHNFDVKLKFE